eukprot:PhM_4_TR18601/c0_g7_i1/m.30902
MFFGHRKKMPPTAPEDDETANGRPPRRVNKDSSSGLSIRRPAAVAADASAAAPVVTISPALGPANASTPPPDASSPTLLQLSPSSPTFLLLKPPADVETVSNDSNERKRLLSVSSAGSPRHGRRASALAAFGVDDVESDGDYDEEEERDDDENADEGNVKYVFSDAYANELNVPRFVAETWYDVCRIFCMASSPGARIFTGGANNGNISIWNGHEGRKEGALMGHMDCALSLMYSGGVLYSGSADGTARSWNLSTLKCRVVYRGHRALVNTVYVQSSLQPTGLFTGSDDHTVKRWNVVKGVCIYTFSGHRAPVNCVRVLPDGHMLVACNDGKVHAWELPRERRKRWEVTSGGAAVWCIDTIVPEYFVVTSGADGCVRIWGDWRVGGMATPPPLVHVFKPLTQSNLWQVLIHGSFLMASSDDGHVYIWDWDTRRDVDVLDVAVGPHARVTGLQLQNNTLFASSVDMGVRRWPLDDLFGAQRQAVVLLRPLEEAAIRGDGVTLFDDGGAAVAAVDDDEEKTDRDDASPTSLEGFSAFQDIKSEDTDGGDDDDETVALASSALVSPILSKAAQNVLEDHPLTRARLIADERPRILIERYNLLPVHVVIPLLHQRVSQFALARELRVYLLFLISFALFAFAARPVEANFYWVKRFNEAFVEAPLPGIRRSAGGTRNYYSIRSKADFRLWFHGVLLPAVYPMANASKQSYAARPSNVRNNSTVMRVPWGNQYLIGAVRVRVLNMRPRSCSAQAQAIMNSSSPTSCYGRMSASLVETGPIGGVRYLEDAGAPYWGLEATAFHMTPKYPSGGHVVEVPFGPNYFVENATALADKRIFDALINDTRTRFVQVEVVSYSPFLDQFLLSMLTAEVAATGAWTTHARHTVFSKFGMGKDALATDPETYLSTLSMARGRTNQSGITSTVLFEVYFGLLVGLYTLYLLRGLVRAIFIERLALRYFSSGWNWLDLTALVMLALALWQRGVWLVHSLSLTFTLPPEGPPAFPSKLVDTVLPPYDAQTRYNAINIILLFVRLFKYLRLNSRLVVLALTLRVNAEALLGVLAFSCWSLFSFALAANQSFGCDIADFRNLNQAMGTMLRMVQSNAGNDYFTDMVFATNFTFAVIFYWTFHVITSIIFLNLFVAVLVDAFVDVSRQHHRIPLHASITRLLMKFDLGYLLTTKWIRLGLRRLYHRTSRAKVCDALLQKLFREFSHPSRHEITSHLSHTVYTHTDQLALVPEGVKMSSRHFLDAVPREHRLLVGRRFLHELWGDMAWEYHHTLLVSGTRPQVLLREATHEAVASSLRGLTVTLRELDRCVPLLRSLGRMASQHMGGGQAPHQHHHLGRATRADSVSMIEAMLQKSNNLVQENQMQPEGGSGGGSPTPASSPVMVVPRRHRQMGGGGGGGSRLLGGFGGGSSPKKVGAHSPKGQT